MKTYEIIFITTSGFDGEKKYIKTDATSEQIQEAIGFVQRGTEKTIEKLLQALRILGFKATEVKIEAVETFEL